MVYVSIFMLVLIWVMLFRQSYRFGFIHVSFIFLSFQYFAVTSIGVERGNLIPSIIFLSGMLGLLLGLIIGNRKYKHGPLLLKMSLLIKSRHQHNNKLGLFVGLVTLSVIYHYAVGGIPILSSNVLTVRFDNNTSGLFGLPGRINLFGTYFAFFLASISYLSTNDPRTKKIALFSSVVLLTSLVLGGNKGNIIQFIVAVIFLSPYTIKTFINKSTLQAKHKGFDSRYYLMAAVIAVTFYISVSSIHMSAGDSLYSSPVEAISKRIFEVSGQAFYIVATELIENEGFGYGKYLMHDLTAFLGNLGVVDDINYTTTQIASSYVTGRALDAGLFLVPVTITSNGYFLIEFGYLGPFALSAALGILMSYLYYAPLRTANITHRAYFLFAQSFVFWFITKGSLGYYGPNMLIMSIFFSVSLAMISAVLKKHTN